MTNDHHKMTRFAQSGNAEGFAAFVQNNIESNDCLRHRLIQYDCFEFVGEWIKKSTIKFKPEELFSCLKIWSEAQYLGLCGLYHFYRHQKTKAQDFFKKSIQKHNTYQPSHYYLKLIEVNQEKLSLQWQCPKPYQTLDIQQKSAGVCCTSWVPYSVGDPSQENGEELWQGNKIKKIRDSIKHGNYHYCNPSYCPHLKNAIKKETEQRPITRTHYKVTQSPAYLQLSYDRSCNLKCPSCRKNIIQASHDEKKLFKTIQSNCIEPLLKDSNTLVSITYSGDPFASSHYRKLLHRLKSIEYQNIGIAIATNGINLTPEVWQTYSELWRKVKLITISVDAATKRTYQKMRPPGDWDLLIKNLRYLAKWKDTEKLGTKLILNFCVQSDNLSEMIAFYDLAEQLCFDQVYYQRLLNWGMYTTEEYNRLDVAQASNIRYKDLINHLNEIQVRSLKSPQLSVRFGAF